MVRTAEVLSSAFWFSHDRRCMMAADIEESPQNTIVASNDENGLAGDFSRGVLTGVADLSGARHYLP